MGEFLISQGERATVDNISRGGHLVSSERGYWHLRMLYVLGAIGCSSLAIFFAVYYLSTDDLFSVHGALSVLVMPALLLYWLVDLLRVLVSSSPEQPRPGVYERGVQLMRGVFVPFEEIGYAGEYGYGFIETIQLVARNKKAHWTIPFLVIGEEGLAVLRRAISDDAAPVMLADPATSPSA